MWRIFLEKYVLFSWYSCFCSRYKYVLQNLLEFVFNFDLNVCVSWPRDNYPNLAHLPGVTPINSCSFITWNVVGTQTAPSQLGQKSKDTRPLLICVHWFCYITHPGTDPIYSSGRMRRCAGDVRVKISLKRSLNLRSYSNIRECSKI